jgi:hypothetical protein
MTINNPDLYNDAWDWGILKGCFGEVIEPTDVDGSVERHGRYLWIETKRPGVSIPQGQRIYLKGLAKRGDTVLIIWGNKNYPVSMAIWWMNTEIKIDDANIDILRDWCNRWYQWANKTPPPRLE